jgi:hypothetical protein
MSMEKAGKFARPQTAKNRRAPSARNAIRQMSRFRIILRSQFSLIDCPQQSRLAARLIKPNQEIADVGQFKEDKIKGLDYQIHTRVAVMIGLLAIAALVQFVASVASEPAQMKLSDLQTLCSGREAGEACRFYVLGVMEGTVLAASLAKDALHFCVPDGVTQTEIVAVVKRLATADLARFPSDSSLPAVSFIGAALQRNYPCNPN